MSVKATIKLAAAEALAFAATLGVILDEDTATEVAVEAAKAETTLADVVARLVAIDLAKTLCKAVSKAIETGEIPEVFDRGDRYQELVTTGMDNLDPRIAFQASLRSAYSAGRYERGIEDEDSTHWVYRTMRDERVRSSHQVLNGVALPKDDPWWDEHYPPNGWRCRCKAYATNEQGLSRLESRGVPVLREAPEEETIEYKDKTTGKTVKLPASVEPGWDFIPAKDPDRLAQMLKRRTKLLEDGIFE